MWQDKNLHTCTIAFVAPATEVDHQLGVINQISRCQPALLLETSFWSWERPRTSWIWQDCGSQADGRTQTLDPSLGLLLPVLAPLSFFTHLYNGRTGLGLCFPNFRCSFVKEPLLPFLPYPMLVSISFSLNIFPLQLAHFWNKCIWKRDSVSLS